MRKLICMLAVSLLPGVAMAGPNPPWAYPAGPPAPQPDASKIITVPGSDKKYNEVEVNNPYGPPDWFPGDHPAMPKVVAQGARPEPRACSLCHLSTGDGHPESAGIAGLPASYIIRQLKEFQSAGRLGARAPVMIAIARGMTEEGMRGAATYPAANKPA